MKKLTFSLSQQGYNQSVGNLLRGTSLEELYLENIDFSGRENLQAVVQNCNFTALKKFSANKCQLNDERLDNLLSSMIQDNQCSIKQLEIRYNSDLVLNELNETLKCIFSNITCLNICGCSQISDKSLSKILSIATHLIDLDISDLSFTPAAFPKPLILKKLIVKNSKLSSDTLGHLLWQTNDAMGKSYLEALTVSYYEVSDRNFNINAFRFDEQKQRGTKGFPQLTSLALGHCEDEVMQLIIKLCGKLQKYKGPVHNQLLLTNSLFLEDLELLKSEKFVYDEISFINVKKLVLHNPSLEFLVEILKKTKNLETLNLFYPVHSLKMYHVAFLTPLKNLRNLYVGPFSERTNTYGEAVCSNILARLSKSPCFNIPQIISLKPSYRELINNSDRSFSQITFSQSKLLISLIQGLYFRMIRIFRWTSDLTYRDFLGLITPIPAILAYEASAIVGIFNTRMGLKMTYAVDRFLCGDRNIAPTVDSFLSQHLSANIG